MRAVLQRVLSANVHVKGEEISSIKEGVLLFLGIEVEDTAEDINWLTKKLVNLRIFSDDDGKMNRSLLDVNGDVLVVSQFTLHASTKKGNRPSFVKAAPPEVAVPLYTSFIQSMETALGKKVAAGQFGANMQVGLVNDGPVTIILDSKDKR
ncbi:MAG: D-tyrosyl-tRNA(Tyr) deacylase [Verrucomicrobia bacterium]|nr:D-tyrosyl-tRNA(Tyr) deacylase [Verrucomicrobiota bacterium]|tara:strand:+ start:1056 stop:1508 length:453 start_codon:yes stop_codon:yes gene_type:complete